MKKFEVSRQDVSGHGTFYYVSNGVDRYANRSGRLYTGMCLHWQSSTVGGTYFRSKEKAEKLAEKMNG